jgi:hypothetical protein
VHRAKPPASFCSIESAAAGTPGSKGAAKLPPCFASALLAAVGQLQAPAVQEAGTMTAGADSDHVALQLGALDERYLARCALAVARTLMA